MKKGSCKNFIGIQHKECSAGVNAREITGGDTFGWVKRIPCHKWNNSEITCQSYAEPTDEEIKQEADEWERVIQRLTTAMPLIDKLKKENKGGGSGVTECPICDARLSYSVSGLNGHVHAKCETEKCLSIME